MKKRYRLLLASVCLMSFLVVGCSPAEEETQAASETEVTVEVEADAKESGAEEVTSETETAEVLVEIPKVLENYNYISPEDVKAHIDAGDVESGAVLMVSSQTEEELAVSHMKGKLITNNARPLKTVDDYAKLEPSYEIIKDTDAPVILICPGGKSGATRQFDYFVAKGIDADRLMILENGQGNFSEQYPEYVVLGEDK